MLEVLPILAYYDLFNENCVKAKKVQANYYEDMHGAQRKELLITLQIPTPLPKPITASAGNCYFRGEGESATLKVPIYEEELKYFYSNYKDYYYLPEEDMAVHKSVATYVDKDYRENAHASNCYTRKSGAFLPQYESIMQPEFREGYKDKISYFELTDDFCSSDIMIRRYIDHILKYISSPRKNQAFFSK